MEHVSLEQLKGIIDNVLKDPAAIEQVLELAKGPQFAALMQQGGEQGGANAASALSQQATQAPQAQAQALQAPQEQPAQPSALFQQPFIPERVQINPMFFAGMDPATVSRVFSGARELEGNLLNQNLALRVLSCQQF